MRTRLVPGRVPGWAIPADGSDQMMSVSLLSLSPEMLSRIRDAEGAAGRGGGQPRERGWSLAVIAAAAVAGAFTGLMLIA